MCLFQAPDVPKAAIPPAVKPLQQTDTATPEAKPLVTEDTAAKTEYGSDKTEQPNKVQQNAASLRIPLGGSDQAGADQGGLS